MSTTMTTDAKGGSRPVPDPTELTTAALLREIANMRELVELRINGVNEVTTARVEGFRHELISLKDDIAKRPGEIDMRIHALTALHDEKFESIQTQFRERDTRGEQTQRDSKVAVDAALQAAKEAVGKQNESSALSIAKSETATNKQIDQLQALISAGGKATDDKVGDLKERLTRIEGQSLGTKAAEVTQHTSNAGTVGIIGLVVGGIGVVTAIIVALVRFTH